MSDGPFLTVLFIYAGQTVSPSDCLYYITSPGNMG